MAVMTAEGIYIPGILSSAAWWSYVRKSSLTSYLVTFFFNAVCWHNSPYENSRKTPSWDPNTTCLKSLYSTGKNEPKHTFVKNKVNSCQQLEFISNPSFWRQGRTSERVTLQSWKRFIMIWSVHFPFPQFHFLFLSECLCLTPYIRNLGVLLHASFPVRHHGCTSAAHTWLNFLAPGDGVGPRDKF